MLNLASDWLASLLPHTLKKVNRVHYGLLRPHELARLWLNAGAAWIAVGSSSAAPEWISVPEGQQEIWPELLYWSGLRRR